jgi:hypothetical protein
MDYWEAGRAQRVQRHARGLGVRRSNPGVRRDFPRQSRPAMGPTQPPIQWLPGLSRGVKRQGRGVDYPPATSAEVKERAELYLCSPPLGIRGLL